MHFQQGEGFSRGQMLCDCETSRRFVYGCGSGGVWCGGGAVSPFHYNITSKERVLLWLLLTAVRSTALLVDTNFAESPSSWETQRRPGDLDTQWRPAREWVESCWRLGHLLETERGPGDWVETCHVHEQASHCGAVVAAWSWQRASPASPGQPTADYQ